MIILPTVIQYNGSTSHERKDRRINPGSQFRPFG